MTHPLTPHLQEISAVLGRYHQLDKARWAYRVSLAEWHALACAIWAYNPLYPDPNARTHNPKYDKLTILGVDIVIDERLVPVSVLKNYEVSG